jgi:hypothetical protein
MNNAIVSLKHFVNIEYDTEERNVRQLWQQPLARRVAEGEAIERVDVVQASWESARLRCQDNLFKFRPAPCDSIAATPKNRRHIPANCRRSGAPNWSSNPNMASLGRT